MSDDKPKRSVVQLVLAGVFALLGAAAGWIVVKFAFRN